MFESLGNSVPSETWDNLPADFVRQKRHYLYGAPGRESDGPYQGRHWGGQFAGT